MLQSQKIKEIKINKKVKEVFSKAELCPMRKRGLWENSPGRTLRGSFVCVRMGRGQEKGGGERSEEKERN